uniref:ATP synthase F0 subunit 8 n=1 Tax=Apsilochorema nigrum TaxID=1875165 RepID=UPI0022DCE130|nr:ATP synthase F0 subunit 8 [Apsilochorema nigrum]UZZ43795.1 ATP synthase F0 subunit 8 [Apsilochorema nigrum]
MPQMMPINWIMLFIYFIILFIIFNSMNYYNFFYKINKSLTTHQKKIFMFNWKW